MIVFIDTNKYLDFYRGSDHSLFKLNSLINLLEKKEIEIVIPKQVYDEFLRDKEIVYRDFLTANFKTIKVPGFLSGKNSAISKINKSIDKIKIDYNKKVFSPRSKINIAFKKFFHVAKIVPESTEILQNAYFRTLRGNPPRKSNKSFGDAIIWETLLRKFSDKDLIIISGDGDWSSELDDAIINPFLAQEWFLENNKKVKLYTSLGLFLNEKTKKSKIKKEIIEEERLLDRSSVDRYSTEKYGVLSVDHLSGISNFIGNGAAVSAVNFPSLGQVVLSPRSCSCCGKSFTPKDYSLSMYGDRCDDCKDIMSIAKNCRECGKHYHESYLLTGSTVLLYPGLCPDCASKK